MFKPIILTIALVGAAVPASAFTQVTSPDANYLNETNLLGVTAPNGPNRGFVTDGDLYVTFSSMLDPRVVGVDWSTWGSPPDTESSAPAIWYTLGATSVTFSFDNPVSTWGFEAEPNPFSTQNFTVEYYQGATLVGTISRSIDGNAGARLLAAKATPGTWFTSVKVTSDTDFAMAQLRYTLAVPEPATWAMLIAGFGMVGYAARRRRSIASQAA